VTCHDTYDESTTVVSSPPRPLYVGGLDDSLASAAALRWAVDKAVATGGEVYAVNVFHPGSVLPASRSPYVPAEVPIAQEEQQAALVQARNIVESALAGVPEAEDARIEVAAVFGDPQVTLIALSTGSDALVLGASHHAGLAARVLGSTALGCAANALCPVMIVPATWVPRGAQRQEVTVA
jgi:nucleotide-binding universal stress UspA family protein